MSHSGEEEDQKEQQEGDQEVQQEEEQREEEQQEARAVVHQGIILTSRSDLQVQNFLVNGHVIKSRRNRGGGMRLNQRVLLLVPGTVLYVLLVGTFASRVFEMEP